MRRSQDGDRRAVENRSGDRAPPRRTVAADWKSAPVILAQAPPRVEPMRGVTAATVGCRPPARGPGCGTDGGADGADGEGASPQPTKPSAMIESSIPVGVLLIINLTPRDA